MERQVRIVPGVIVSRSIAATMKFMGAGENPFGEDMVTLVGHYSPEESFSPHSTALLKENPTGDDIGDLLQYLSWLERQPTSNVDITESEPTNPEHGGMESPLELDLGKELRLLKIGITKGKTHGWRRDENGARRERVRRNEHPYCRALPAGMDSMIIYTEPSNRKPIVPLLTELAELYEEEVPAAKHLRGVNAILEYIGVQTEPEKTAYLRSFNRYSNDRTTYRGVDAVRTGWHIASFYGKTDDKGFVKSAIQSAGENGTRLTDAAIQRFGAESLQDIVKYYSSLRVNGLLSLVPTRDLGRIISAMRDPILGDFRGPAFMRELGFEVYRLGRTPILYSKPTSR